MTVDKQYHCDLCREKLGFVEGIGIYWRTDNSIDWKYCCETEHHLCRNCFWAIRALDDPFDESQAGQRVTTT